MKPSLLISMALSLGFAISACGGATAGDSCTSDGDCSDMKCLHDEVLNSDNRCVDEPGEGTCSPACKTNADCATYGSTFKCALSSIDVACNPTGICRENYSCSGSGCREAPDH